MKFSYRAFDLAGREHRDVLEAANLGDAEEQLRRKGLFVAEMMARGTAAALAVGEDGPGRPAGRRLFAGGKTGRLRELSGFMRQLSVLVATGTPMVDALASLERQVPPGEWQQVLADVRRRIEEGVQLSEAMAQHPRYFDAVCRSLIAAGEGGGRIEDMLRRLSSLVRQQLKVRSGVIGAMVYPMLLVVVSLGVMGAMIGFVLPRFEGLFQTLEAPLPPTTKLMMGLAAWVRIWWWLVLIVVVGGSVGLKVYLGTKAGRRGLDRLVVRLPQFGKVFRSLATARIMRVLGVLLEGKVPLLDALQLTRESTGNSCYAELIQNAEDRVIRGENVSAAFAASRLVPQSVSEAVRSGEKTGQMAAVLTSLADYLDEDNDVVIRSLTSIIEPLILLALGLIVGFMAISMFLPLFDLTAATGPGGAR